ncbi:MAG: hypothetical protein Kow0047_27440 [Anaerolineae bacterium]
MAQLRQDMDRFKAAGAEIIVVGPDDRDAFVRYWREHELPFIGLPDPEHRVADLYGQQVKWLRLGRMPALTLIDRDGYIRHVHYANSMRDIPENDEVLDLIDSLSA